MLKYITLATEETRKADFKAPMNSAKVNGSAPKVPTQTVL
jgi:hypothetical protein